MSPHPLKVEFSGASGAKLAARIDLPASEPRGFALFAHCFTCSKDIAAARVIATALTERGFGVMRFDFTGLGGSGGDFSSTNFSMNMGDLVEAGDYLRTYYQAPVLLIGHSLGGAAVIAAAADLPEVKAIATLNAPADVTHITGHFAQKLPEIEREGAADVLLGERPFRIEKQFIDDLQQHDIPRKAADLKRALLVLHAPTDETVGIENAGRIFEAAKHPKSFVSLDTATHLLHDRRDAEYAAQVIAAWASRYINMPEDCTRTSDIPGGIVRVTETVQGKYQSLVEIGDHAFIADEPVDVGGLDSGPTPYDLLSAALGTCTVMTLRMYADRKTIALERASCDVTHQKTHADDMAETQLAGFRPDLFTRTIRLEGDIDEATHSRMMEIADKCPVHKTLHKGARVETRSDET